MHDRRDVPLAHAIDRYWDEVFQGSPAGSDPEALDPDLAATVRRVHALNVAPTADRVFASRLWADLMGAQGIAGGDRPRPTVDPAPSGRAVATPLRPAPVPFGAPPTRHRWGLARLATAVVLLLVFGLVYIASGPNRSDDGRRAALPAMVLPTGTPAPAATAEESLLVLTLPAESLPRGQTIGSGIADAVIPPGIRSTWEPLEPYCCPGPMVEYVIEGTYTVRADAAIRVVRADGATEEAPAGTAVTLGPGDSLISRNETVVETANTGTTPVILLNWTLIAVDPPGSFSGHRLTGWTQNSADVQEPLTLSAGPATLRLRRVELAPGAADMPPPGSLSFVVVLPQNAAGTPVPTFYGRQADGALRNTSSRNAITVYILTLEPAGGAAGSPVVGSTMPWRAFPRGRPSRRHRAPGEERRGRDPT